MPVDAGDPIHALPTLTMAAVGDTLAGGTAGTEGTGLADAILENAAGPRKASGDSGSVEQHSLPDQIQADRYAASRSASRSKKLGIRVGRFGTPGSA